MSSQTRLPRLTVVPAYFYPSRMAAQTDMSSVAASGIAIVSYFIHNLTALEQRSSLWLSHPVNSGIVYSSFRKKSTSPASRERLDHPFRGVPFHFCCLDFPLRRNVGARIQCLSANVSISRKSKNEDYECLDFGSTS